MAARPGIRCWVVSKEETQWGCLYCWHFRAAGLVFQPYCSDQRAVAEVWPCESSGVFGGGPWLSAAPNAPCNQRSYLCHLAHSCLPFLCISPLCLCHKLSRLSSPPFLRLFSFQQEDTCVWEVVVFLPLLFQPALPSPEPLLRTPALCVFYGCC